MKRLLHAFRWDIKLYMEQGFLWPALLSAGCCFLALRMSPPDAQASLAPLFLVLHLVLAFFIPMALHIRREKSLGLLAWINATPLRPHEYLASKAAIGLIAAFPAFIAVALGSGVPLLRVLPLFIGAEGGGALVALVAFLAVGSSRSAAQAWLGAIAGLAFLGAPALLHGWIHFPLFPMQAVLMLADAAVIPGCPLWMEALVCGVAGGWAAVSLLACKSVYSEARLDPIVLSKS